MKSSPPTRRALERVDVAERGEKDDRHAGAIWLRADVLAHGESVDLVHADVEEDAVGPFAIEERQRFCSALRE